MSTRKETRPGDESSPATYQDVLDAPSHKVSEIIDGTLHMSPRPASIYGRASSGLVANIGLPYDYGTDGPGGWWIIFGPELHLGEDVLVPDVAGWRRERMPEFPDVKFFTLAPDWAYEVISPSTMTLDRAVKRLVYAREGVGHLWLVEPDARILEAFELRDGHWTLLETLTDDGPISLPPFEGISFEFGGLCPDGGAG